MTADLPADSGMVDVSWTRSDDLSPSVWSCCWMTRRQGSCLGRRTSSQLGSSAQFSGMVTPVSIMSWCSRSRNGPISGTMERTRLRNRDGGINEKMPGAASRVLNRTRESAGALETRQRQSQRRFRQMSNKTRKRIGPVSLVMSLAIIGALAAFIVLATNPGGVPSAAGPPAGSPPASGAS